MLQLLDRVVQLALQLGIVSAFTCIGTSGSEATLFDSPILQTRIAAKNTTSPPGGDVDPEAFLNAIKNFMDNMNSST